MNDHLAPVRGVRHQRQDERASRPEPPSGPVHSRFALAALATGSAVMLLAGCGGPDTAAVAKSSKPPTIKNLGAAVGCKPENPRKGKLKDYRQGVCKVKKTTYTFVTFDNNKAKRGYLDYSKWYGGTYLVGSRWIVVTQQASKLGVLQAKFGGSVEKGRQH